MKLSGMRAAGLLPRVARVGVSTAALILLLLAPAATALAVAPAHIIVDTLSDTSGDGDGDCSLREALTNSNISGATSSDCEAGTAAVDIVDLTGLTGEIQVTTTLPLITRPVFIDGGSIGSMVAIRNYGGPGHDGLWFMPGSKGSTVRGIKVVGFNIGFRLEGDGTTLYNNRIGTLDDGTTVANLTGIFVNSKGNIIGVPGQQANIISGNTDEGIVMYPVSSGTLIQNNWIGLGSNNVAIPNLRGIDVQGKTATIGGIKPGQSNVISGNTNSGIELGGNATGTKIQHNLIGLDILGGSDRPNGTGIYDKGSIGTTIGGAMTTAGNFISGNTGYGIFIDDSEHSSKSMITISGNIIGLDGTGASEGNGSIGIIFSLATTQIKAKVSNNLITQNPTGIVISAGGNFSPILSGSTGNCIAGNGTGFIDNPSHTDITFTKNWWGDPSGPSGSYSGTGDSAGPQSVKVVPFLTTPPAACNGWLPKTFTPANGGFSSKTTAPLKFSWAKVPGARVYSFKLTEDLAQTTDATTPGTTPFNSFTTQTPLPYGDYFWQITTKGLNADAVGWKGPIQTFYVTIQTSPPPNSKVNAGNVTLKWSAYPGASAYNVDWFTSSDCSGGGTTFAPGNAHSVTVPGVTASTYSWQVKADVDPTHPMPCWTVQVGD